MHAGMPQAFGGLCSALFYAERFLEIAAGAAADERQDRIGRNRSAHVEEAVDALVDGAVAAHRDDFVMALAQGIRHQHGRVALSSRERDRHIGVDYRQRALDTAPFAADVAGTRIDDDEGAHAAFRVQ